MPVSQMRCALGNKRESPEYVRLSLAAAMTLGFTGGWFYRNARLGCINLLLTYLGGCKANCTFCGLSAEKGDCVPEKNFIRVPWKSFPTDLVIDALKMAPDHVGRVCISMITHPRCRDDVLRICRRVTHETGLAVSLLISPSVMGRDDLRSMKDAGADHIGVAVDAATRDLFVRHRGKPVKGPHRWDKYWKVYEESLRVFGEGMAGVHLICGLGETERELALTISQARTMGGFTHLFSFFPEKGSAMESVQPPPIGSYRRIQLTRWLVDNNIIRAEHMEFDDIGRIRAFGLSGDDLERIVHTGIPFETSGCPGPDGKVACNRPYGNEKPGGEIRNFPFTPDEDDVKRIAEQLVEYV